MGGPLRIKVTNYNPKPALNVSSRPAQVTLPPLIFRFLMLAQRVHALEEVPPPKYLFDTASLFLF
jgi:hypothetical protein